MLIGKPGTATTSISTADAAGLTVRGKDLCSDLMGRLGFTEYFYLLVTGREPSREQRFFLDLLLVSIAEHGLVPTNQVARMTYDADPSSLQGAVAAGILGCGSVVLGTSELCGQFLVEAREKAARQGTQAADTVRAMAKSIHAEGGKVPGFGHPLHRPVDPRTERIFALSEERGVAGIHVGLARHAQAAVGEVWQKQLLMNVSMAIAAILLDLDFPAAMIKAIPILARTGGLLAHLAEWAAERGIDIRNASVRNILVAGEPGGGEPVLRARLQEAWGASVTEAMGIGDISVSLWGECEARSGMHFSGGGFVHFELIDAGTGAPLPIDDGAEGELVYTHLRHRAAPLLRFRSRNHVRVHAGPCACGRTTARVRCIGRTDDMLIIRGVNVFQTAIREVIDRFAPAVSGVISIRPGSGGVKQDPPLPVTVELAEGTDSPGELADEMRKRIRDTLLVATSITLVPAGTLPRSDYKSKLVDWPDATG